MGNISDYIKSRMLVWWLTLTATIFAVAALILYAAAGVTNYDPHHSVQVIVGLILIIVLGIAGIVVRFRPFAFAQYVLSVFSLFSYIFSNMNMLGSIFYTAGGQSNIDGTTLPATFVLLTVFMALVLVASLVAGILMRPENRKAAAKEERP